MLNEAITELPEPAPVAEPDTLQAISTMPWYRAEVKPVLESNVGASLVRGLSLAQGSDECAVGA